jgi:D-glucosaminate-6-phosphate ammonia-lyase
MQNIYAKLGVKTRINAVGYATALGGSLMSNEVLSAMNEASQHFIDMAELQAAASSLLSDCSGAEAGIVTSGASGALTLGAAACIVGLDASKMDKLPDTDGMPNEIIMHCSHRCAYDHAIRASGAKIRTFGLNDIAAKAGGRGIEDWEVEASITPNTVALGFIASAHNLKDLKAVVSVCNRYKIPILVDAAPLLPPVDNLKRFIESGASLVAFSGGKAIRGPQGTGILIGNHDLIAAAALQQFDMGGCPETWSPPLSLIPRDKLKGIPHHGIGRGLKVSKEEIVGFLVALDQFINDDQNLVNESMQELLIKLANDISKLKQIKTKLISVDISGIRPLLELHFNEGAIGMTTIEISRLLKAGTPAINLNERRIYEGVLIVDPAGLRPEECFSISNAFKNILKSDQVE